MHPICLFVLPHYDEFGMPGFMHNNCGHFISEALANPERKRLVIVHLKSSGRFSGAKSLRKTWFPHSSRVAFALD